MCLLHHYVYCTIVLMCICHIVININYLIAYCVVCSSWCVLCYVAKMPVIVDADGYNSFDLVSANEVVHESEVSEESMSLS